MALHKVIQNLREDLTWPRLGRKRSFFLFHLNTKYLNFCTRSDHEAIISVIAETELTSLNLVNDF